MAGEPRESEEMRPQWYRIDKLPFENMWIDDPHWLPIVLAGTEDRGTNFLFDKSGDAMLDLEMTIIK